MITVINRNKNGEVFDPHTITLRAGDNTAITNEIRKLSTSGERKD